MICSCNFLIHILKRLEDTPKYGKTLPAIFKNAYEIVQEHFCHNHCHNCHNHPFVKVMQCRNIVKNENCTMKGGHLMRVASEEQWDNLRQPILRY